MGLHGKTILTTRAASQSGELRSKLEARGARVIECPTIEIVAVDDWSAVDLAAAALNTYDWLLFTSGNAVGHFMRRVQMAAVRCTIPIAVVGTSTARRLREWGLEPAIVPREFRAEGLLQVMPRDLDRTSILFPRAEAARDTLPRELRRRGARVDIVTVYRTNRPPPGSRSIADILSQETIDCVIFTSPSTIRYVAESVGELLLSLLQNTPIAVIGPVTESAVSQLGLRSAIMPVESTIDELIAAMDRSL